MDHLSRRDFLNHAVRGVALAGLAGCAGPGTGLQGNLPAGGKRPNILFIMSDDHAAHALSCYGSRINKTPNLDRIAREGARFENCFVTNSICAPSRACILTGKYAHMNGLMTNRDTFDGNQQTFPKLLQKAGYHTAMIGKWHLKSSPTGFDYWTVLPGQGRYHDPRMIEMGEKTRLVGYTTDIITDKAIDYLETVRDRSKPFCMMVHHKAPHRRWEPDEKHASLFDGVKIPEPDTFNDDYTNRATPASRTTMTIEKHLTEKDVKGKPPEGLTPAERKSWHYQRYIKDYLRCVASVDDNVGRLLDYLKESGLEENTLVVYTSDQGFFLGDHGWYDKRFMYEHSLRMPLLVRYPGVVPAGTVNDEIVVNADFGPTFLALAGLSVPEDMQGRSMKPVLEGRTPRDWRESMYYHYYEYPAVHSVRRHYGLRTKRYKLIHFYHHMEQWELFDLKKDPDELNNVYADPAYADIVAKLKVELERKRRELRDDSAEGSLVTHPDFDRAYSVEIGKSPFGYEITSGSNGVAMKKTPTPFRKSVTFRCRLKTRRKDGTRNGLIAFGQDGDPEHLVKAGVYIGANNIVILHGRFGCREKDIVRKKVKFDKAGTFDVTVQVDLEKKTVTLEVGGTTLTGPLGRNWKEINYYGFFLHRTVTAFSQLQVVGS